MIMRPLQTCSVIAVLLAAGPPQYSRAGTSANYSHTPETLDTGGGRATSASYGVTAASTAGTAGTSPAYSLRSGFAGQLSEPVSLFLSATPPIVNEAATTQIAAFLVQDESILVPQNASTLAWTVVSGPITSVSPSGLATTAPVYQTSAATVRGTLGALSATVDLQVENNLPDNFGSYAADSLDDAWQVEFFGLGNTEAAPAADPDHDGQDNRFEFDAGLSPVDPASRFLIEFTPVPNEPLSVGILFSPRLPDRTYALFAAPTPDRSTATPVTPGTIIDTGDQRLVADPNPGSQRKFYHVRITRP